MPDVRTTFKPEEVRSVSASEFLDLDRQGLILEVVTTPPAPVKTETSTKVPVKTVSSTDKPTPAKPSDTSSAKASDK